MSAAAPWIFGYGSLVWRPAFAHLERAPGFVRGHRRRFWQGSTDHRGVPGAPGRVVTLVPGDPDESCWGTAYRIPEERLEAIIAMLDERERGGYEQLETEVVLADERRVPALLYIATPANPNWLGEAPLGAIAEQVRRSHGPSGSNRDYVLELADALARMGVGDDHVDRLAELLR